MLYADLLVIDWSILRCCRNVDLSIDTGSSTEPSGHVQLLPREYLSGHDQSKRTQQLELPPFFPTAILSTEPRSLGKRTLVLEPRDQPYMCPPCNATAAMGTTVSQDHSVALRSAQASKDPRVLFRRRREMSPTMGGRCLAHASSHLPLPFLRRPCCLPLQRQSHDLQVGVIVGRPLCSSIRVHHLHADISSRQPILHTTLFACVAHCYRVAIFLLSVSSMVQSVSSILSYCLSS